MAIYNSNEAKYEAVAIAKMAVQAGWLAPVLPANSSNPSNNGKSNAHFVGAFIKQLAAELESL